MKPCSETSVSNTPTDWDAFHPLILQHLDFHPSQGVTKSRHPGNTAEAMNSPSEWQNPVLNIAPKALCMLASMSAAAHDVTWPLRVPWLLHSINQSARHYTRRSHPAHPPSNQPVCSNPIQPFRQVLTHLLTSRTLPLDRLHAFPFSASSGGSVSTTVGPCVCLVIQKAQGNSRTLTSGRSQVEFQLCH